MGMNLAPSRDFMRQAIMKSQGQNLEKMATEQQKETAARIQNFGLMGAYAAPQARQQMNNALRVRASEMSPSIARRMNRKGV